MTALGDATAVEAVSGAQALGRAERDLRPAVIQRKVTNGYRAMWAAQGEADVRTVLDTANPVARGMPRESVAWVEDSPVFEIKSDPLALARVRVIARYPDAGTPLLSGWLLGAERIRGKAALVEVELGKGRVYLFGFRPQYRAQSLATYPLLFNAIKGAK